MKLKKLIKLCEPFNLIKIYSNEEDEDLIYEGTISNIPWWLVECKIPKTTLNGDEPIHSWWHKENEKDPLEGILIVYVIE